jgi:hypothetical protein
MREQDKAAGVILVCMAVFLLGLGVGVYSDRLEGPLKRIASIAAALMVGAAVLVMFGCKCVFRWKRLKQVKEE